MLKRYKKSPLHYKEEEFEETAPMKMGTAYHTLILEPEKVDQKYFILDEMQRPEKTKTMDSNINKDWKRELYEKYGENILNKNIFGQLKVMKDRLFSHSHAKTLLTKGEKELSHYTELDGIKVKIRPDNLRLWKNTIVDLKTCAGASEDAFIRQAFKLGYHISGAFYCDIAEAIYKTGKPWVFIIIAQETKHPFAFNIFRFDMDDDRDSDELMSFLAMGRHEYLACLDEHKYCTDNNKWNGYQVFADNEYGVIRPRIPAYLYKNYTFYNKNK